MPSIIIRERDLTSAGSLEVTSNTVYIPGYSNMGPTNIPTLCETLADFQATFGSEPYMFRQAQDWPHSYRGSTKVYDFGAYGHKDTMGKFCEKGEYEKSYIMAAELLKLGIPVLYERVASTTPIKVNEDDTSGEDIFMSPLDLWTATAEVKSGSKQTENSVNNVIKAPEGAIKVLDIKSTYSGRVASDIHFNIINNEVIFKDNNIERTAYYYTIVVEREANIKLGTSKIDKVSTNFTFDSEVAAKYSSCKLVYPGQSFIDNSGLVEVTIESTVDISNITYLESETTRLKTDTLYEKVYKNFEMQLALAKTGLWSDENPDKVTVDMDEFKVKDMYDTLADSKYDPTTKEPLGLYRLLDKGEYVIKFITSGAYPIFEYKGNTLASNFAWVAAERGDCTALIDHTPNNERTLWAEADASVFNQVKTWASSLSPNSLGEDSATYSAMFTPWGIYTSSIANKLVMLPASFGYLSALAASTQVNGSWAAAAGVARGSVPGLVSLCQNVTNAIADSYSNRDSISINPITNIKPYGLLIWGNRTLKNNAKKGNLTATSFLSIRQLTNDVKRTVWVAAKTLTFEQNNDVLWINFKSKIIPTLDLMVSGGGLSGYEIKKQKTDKKATIKAKIVLYAIEPVEDWDITIELADQSTEITG